MSAEPQASLLPDGRLHLHHGPIDLIIGVEGPARNECYLTATSRFQTVLAGLAAELPQLRQPLKARVCFDDLVARRMAQAIRPYDQVFVTPMAAVAGAVADEILASMIARREATKVYVNNGGDIAFHLAGCATFKALGPAGEITVKSTDMARGLATSGWRGRSHSRGIADAVTVLARSAAAADVAATLIANAVDLPGHSAIARVPASDLAPDSDLGQRLVTTNVGALPDADVTTALSSGASFARDLIDSGHILQAVLSLQGQIKTVTAGLVEGATAHA